MATIKSYTDLEQSKKLAEILPLESADMCYLPTHLGDEHHWIASLSNYSECTKMTDVSIDYCIPCWSLASLLNVLPYPKLSKDKLGSGKVGWMVSVYPNDCRYDSCWHDNPVDACYELVLKLNELKML